MATLTFGDNTTAKTANDYITEIRELLGVCCPIDVLVSSEGKLLQVTVETVWNEGEVIPIEEEIEVEKTVVNSEGVEEIVTELQTVVVDYQQDYTEKKLTQKQITDLNNYIAENIKP